MAEYRGTADADTIFASDDADIIYAKNGADWIFGQGGDDKVYGGGGADTINGGDGDNSLFGGNGDDYVALNPGQAFEQQVSTAGFADGGRGYDTFYLSLEDLTGDQTADFSTLTRGGTLNVGGFTLVNFEAGAAEFGAGNDIVSTGGLKMSVLGGEGDDRIFGGRAANELSGEGGDDLLSGAGGDDTLWGGDGRDTLLGGKGADHLESGASSSLSGGAGDDILPGSLGDTIDGGAGRDSTTLDLQFHGQLSIDLRHVAHATTIAFTDPSLDIVLSRIEAIDLTLGEGGNRVWTGDVDAHVTAGNGGDWIKAGSGVLQASGGTGDDTLIGGSAADFLGGGGGDDLVFGGAGNDILGAGDGFDRLDGGDGDDLFLVIRDIDPVSAVLTGGAGQDVFQFLSLHTPYLINVRIVDLEAQDTIDLHYLDADLTVGDDQAFVQVSRFDGHAGELVVDYRIAKDLTLVKLDVDGDGSSDMTIALSGDHRDFTNFVL